MFTALIAAASLSSAPSTYSATELSAMRQTLIESLRDYDGSRFQGPAFKTAWDAGKDVGVIQGVCFKANLKNGFGGFSGWSWKLLIHSSGSDTQYVHLAQDRDADDVCARGIRVDGHDYAAALFPKG